MLLPTLYSRTSTGAVQTWTIEVEGNAYRTITGQLEGKKITSEWTKVAGKNIGRANATTPEQQAMAEAQAKHKKKSDTGYKLDPKDIDQMDYVEPMLAKKYTDYAGKIAFPVYSDRKYNGMRCVATRNGLHSRNGKEIIAAPHVWQALKPLFDANPDLVLDGELYNHDFRHMLNRTISCVRKGKPDPEALAKSQQIIRYYVYDGYNVAGLGPEEKFSKRKAAITKLLKGVSYTVVVESDLCPDQATLDKKYKQYLAEEYEGQMVRIDGPYEHKRSKLLLKRKEFIDAEFKVLDIIEGDGNKTGMAASVLLQHPDGRTFNSNIKGDFEYLAEVLAGKKGYIGKTATVQFFEYTEYGIPQFPYVIAFDRESVEGKSAKCDED